MCRRLNHVNKPGQNSCTFMTYIISYILYGHGTTRPVPVFIVIAMMTSSNGNIFRVTDHLCGKFTGPRSQRPVTRSFDVFFDLRPNKRLSVQSRGWWFETPSRPLWRHCNETKSDGIGIRSCTLYTQCLYLAGKSWITHVLLPKSRYVNKSGQNNYTFTTYSASLFTLDGYLIKEHTSYLIFSLTLYHSLLEIIL